MAENVTAEKTTITAPPKKKLPLFEVTIALAIGFLIYWNMLRGKEFMDGLSDVWAIAKTILGIGFLIFIHELGHFLAAKWCDVKVETFALGMGPTIPGCSFQRGETLYRIGWLPIGGYVKMLGQVDPGEKEEDPDGAKTNPRSYMNKSVGQRMLIISAGVIFNLIFGYLVFTAVYLNGKEEPVPLFGPITPGLPADKLGLQMGSEILQVDNFENPSYEDMFYASALARSNETVITLRFRTPQGVERNIQIVPVNLGLKPAVGIGFPPGLRLSRDYKPGPFAKFLPGEDKLSPARTGSTAALAPFRSNDLLLAVRGEGEKDFTALTNGADYLYAEHKYRFKTMEVKVRREVDKKVTEETVTVKPNFFGRAGVHMGLAKLVMVREDSPLAKDVAVGDVIVAVNNNSNYDPIRLADHLFDQADTRKPSVLTIRKTDGSTKEVNVPPGLFEKRANWAEQNTGNNTHGIYPLGITFQFDQVVRWVEPGSPAEAAGVKVGDVPSKTQEFTPEGKEENLIEFDPEMKKFNWTLFFMLSQIYRENSVSISFKDSAGTEKTIKNFKVLRDETWAASDRGLMLERGSRIRVAESIGEAFQLGTRDSIRFIQRIYLNLYSLLRGDISIRMLSGPLRMAETTFAFAKRSFWEFLHFLSIISINLAVVNFLPIPVLDGGHMVMLLLEKISGRKINERVFGIVSIIGLIMVLGLMVTTFYVDLTSFEWFRKLFPFLK